MSIPSTISKLTAMYKRYVMYEESEMQKNMQIANDVVSGFQEYLNNETNFSVSILKQGSAFEGIKVGRPEEFDYLLVFDFTGESIQPKEARNVAGSFNRDKLAGYWQLKVDSSSSHLVHDFCNGGALSTTKYKRRFQTAVNRFIEKVGQGYYVQGIRRHQLQSPSIRNPALTITVQKAGGSLIFIDMSICVKVHVSGWVSNSTRYYIAKEHPSEEGENFWLVVNSQQELQKMQTIPDDIKMNYRLTKFLLQKQQINSYIIKTAFLSIYDKNSNATLKDIQSFMTTMLKFLRDAFRSGVLGSYHSSSENLLARYSASFVDNRANYFRRLCNKSFDDVVDELMKQVIPAHYEREAVVESAREEEKNAGWGCTIM